MSQKQLRNRLDTLFNHIEDHNLPTLADMPVEKVVRPGWSWEVDGEARYVSVAKEVEQYLGLSPQEFTGQSLFTFHIERDDQDL
jgi:PAS domain-containing protein